MVVALVEHIAFGFGTSKRMNDVTKSVAEKNPTKRERKTGEKRRAVFALTIYVLVKFIHYPYLDLVATENIPSLSYT